MKSLNQFIFYTFIGIILLIQFGCDTVENNESENIQVLTNTNTYNVDSSVTINLLITNHSSNPIYYVCSGDIYLEEIREGLIIKDWKVYGFEECLAIRRIEPKETKEYNFTYISEHSPFRLQDALYSETVQYRFKIDFYYDENLKTKLTSNDKYSNEIHILK